MRDKPSPKQSRRRSEYERQIIYDREICIEICRRLLLGQDLREICAKPPMPLGPGFLGWIQDHKEAREIDRSMGNFRSDRALAKALGTPLLVGISEWEEQVRANIQRGWPADYIDRGYLPPDWSKVFPIIGGPPASSAENLQAYNDLLNGFTQMLEPRDLMELIWTKQVTDATWDGMEEDEEKNGVLSVAQMARGRDLRRVFEAGFNYCRSTQLAQSRVMRRRDNAVCQLERWRKGLGAKSRRLPDQFLDEQVLAQRYRDQVLTVPDNDVTSPKPAEVAPPAAPAEAAEAMISASPSLAQSDKAGSPPDDSSRDAVKSVARPAPADGAMHVALPTASLGEAVEAAPRPAPADGAMHVAPPIASLGEAVDAVARPAPAEGAVHVAPPTASLGEAVDAVALTAAADGAMHVAPPTAAAGEAIDAVAVTAAADGATHVAPPIAAAGEAVEAVALTAPADGAMQVAPPSASSGEAVEAVALTPPADGAMHVAPPPASSDEAVDAVPSTVRADEAARAEPPIASSKEALEAMPRLPVPPPAPADEPGQAPPPLLATPSDKAAKAALPDGSQRWAA